MDESLETLFDQYMDQVLAEGGDLAPEDFLDAHPELGPGQRAELLERLDAISRLARVGRPAPPPPRPAFDTSDLEGEDLDQRVGEYRLIRRLGGGAMGEVFLAEQSNLGRLVALKTQRSHLADSPTAAARFEREARALGQVTHPSVVRVHDFGSDGEVAFLAMELLPGRSMRERVETPRDDEERPLPALVAAWGAQVARGLEAVHAAGLVHRDVKPSNLRLVAEDGDERAVLVDFGLARLGEASDLSRTGEFLGSPAYASPEQVRGEAELDGRSDVYSLGATLYHALAGRAPFRGADLEAVLHGVLSREPEPLQRLRPDLPRDLCLVVHKALEKSRSQRYPSASAMAADLEAVLELRPVSVKPIGAMGRLLRWSRRNRSATAGMAAALVAVLGALLFVGWTAHQDDLAQREEARGLLVDAREALGDFRGAREALVTDEAEFERLWLLQEYEHLGPEGSARLTELEHRVRDSRERRDEAFRRSERLRASAVRLDPGLTDEAEALGAELVLERLLEARGRKDAEAEAFLLAELEQRDPDRSLRDEAFPYATITLTSSLPGTRAWLFRMTDLDELEGAADDAEWRQVPVPVHPTRPDWAPPEDLPHGEEVLRLAGPVPADLGCAEGDLVTHLDGWPVAGGPLVRLTAGTATDGQRVPAAGDRLTALGERTLADPLELDALLTAEPEARPTFTLTTAAGETYELGFDEVVAQQVGFEGLHERAGRLGGAARVLVDGSPVELDLPPGLPLRRSLAAPVLLASADTPVGEPLELEPGSYLVVTRAPGHRPTRTSLQPGPRVAYDLDVTPLPPEAGPAGYVPVRSSVWERRFWVAEHEVTAEAYRAFLNEPEQLAEVDAALDQGVLVLVPRAQSSDPREPMWARTIDGSYVLPDSWRADWPVLGISYVDAEAYAAWLTEREGHGTYRLPTSHELALAGTGGADQRYSWGTRFDQRFANTCFSRAVARPEPVQANPRDESMLGVYDTCGNALEWATSWFDATRDLRHACGGSWAQARIDVLAVGGGMGYPELAAGGEQGLRLVWTPDPEAGDG